MKKRRVVGHHAAPTNTPQPSRYFHGERGLVCGAEGNDPIQAADPALLFDLVSSPAGRLRQCSCSVPYRPNCGIRQRLGSYIKELRPGIITSDVAPGVADLVIDGRKLPFPDESVQALLLTHVFHHIPDVGQFFSEACRVLVPAASFPWWTSPYAVRALLLHPLPPRTIRRSRRRMELSGRRLDAGLNQALSWMVFCRDKDAFHSRFPALHLERRRYLPWLSYLLSGGVNLRSFVPGPLTPGPCRPSIGF